jgi:hypothetical protein
MFTGLARPSLLLVGSSKTRSALYVSFNAQEFSAS